MRRVAAGCGWHDARRVPGAGPCYPDVTIVCGKLPLADELSPSTEIYDRGLKLRRYREIESVTDYIFSIRI